MPLDSSNSSSVSPGNPTITSVVSAGLIKILSQQSRIFHKYSSAVYLRFILFKVALHPLCKDRWKCGHIFGSAAIACTNSSVIIRGSREPRRIRWIPSTSCTARISSKQIAFPGINAVRTKMDSGQHDFLIPICRQLCALPQPRLPFARLLHPSSGIRDNTVRTELVASVLYL